MQDEINISEDVEGHAKGWVEDAGDEARTKLDGEVRTKLDDDTEGHAKGRVEVAGDEFRTKLDEDDVEGHAKGR
jgi:hypothetical protein